MELPIKKILLIIERDSYKKDGPFIRSIVVALSDTGYRPVWYNPHGVGSSERITSNTFINALPKWLRFPIKALALFARPKNLKHYLSMDALREGTIEGRTKNLKKFIRGLPKNTEVAVLSRSAGGRIASLVADEVGIKKIICLGYPFEHPNHGPELGRYAHLEYLKNPMLILQGARDEYGGEEIMGKYKLSPSVKVDFFDTDHDFQIADNIFIKLIQHIKAFLDS
jgi:hypothetical protein